VAGLSGRWAYEKTEERRLEAEEGLVASALAAWLRAEALGRGRPEPAVPAARLAQAAKGLGQLVSKLRFAGYEQQVMTDCRATEQLRGIVAREAGVLLREAAKP
jgi:hypothetical protein